MLIWINLRLRGTSRSLANTAMSFRVLRMGDFKAHGCDLICITLEALCLPLETPSLQFLELEDKGLFNILPLYVTMS